MHSLAAAKAGDYSYQAHREGTLCLPRIETVGSGWKVLLLGKK